MAFQLGGSLLEACVLAVLQRGDIYGYKLTQEVKSIIEISESTLYPVLRRIQKEDLLETYDESYQGRNRRYYRITELGKEKLGEYQEEWKDYSAKVSQVLLGGEEENE